MSFQKVFCIVMFLALLAVFALNLKAQNVRADRALLSYKEMKMMYSSVGHTPIGQSETGDHYQPLLAGAASLVPGLGQAVCGEPVRGLKFLALNLASAGLALGGTYPLVNNMYEGKAGLSLLGYSMMIMGYIGFCGSIVWSICDAVQVAKIKNWYYREGRMPQVSLTPSIFSLQIASEMRPTPGFRLTLAF